MLLQVILGVIWMLLVLAVLLGWVAPKMNQIDTSGLLSLFVFLLSELIAMKIMIRVIIKVNNAVKS